MSAELSESASNDEELGVQDGLEPAASFDIGKTLGLSWIDVMRASLRYAPSAVAVRSLHPYRSKMLGFPSHDCGVFT